MAIEVLMPLLGEEGEEGVVTAWMVDEGGRVDAGQLLATVQVEKVSGDVTAPVSGVVRGRVDLNEPVSPGAVICAIVPDDEPSPAPAPGPATSTPAPRSDRVAASPSAKRVARELGIDLEMVEGSGPGGRITEADVRAATPAGFGGGGELSGLRAVIARNMRESARVTAPVTLTTTVDVTNSLPDRVTARIVQAVAMALVDHPMLNGTREGDRFIAGGSPHIALAIQTDDGLVAPVVRRPAGRSLEDLAGVVVEVAERARSGGLSAADFRGGTFTVTNLGGYGIEAFTPIINLPQVAILGVGVVRTVPGFDEAGSIVPRREMVLSLTFDHAFVDGAPAAAFLAQLRDRLEEG